MTGTHRPASGGRRETDEDTDPSAAAREDLALLQRLRSGEDAAFGELFSRHADAVRRLALGLVADRAEAEDLAAEAFFRVLQAVRRGAGPVDNVRGYLLIVTRRVAWEWNARKRDVPVSDEELNNRVGAGPDNTGQSTERTLITRAFTSLPERWRSVLWKVEVEGERPAVVAGNFGLSPNATAALARRARQGLRAAYLQAHLTVDRGSTGCRSVLEKLGAYTAGSIKGTERRKIRAHLATCPSCTTMQAELQDVCSGLRAHAAFLAAPVAGIALWQQIGLVSAAAATTKGGTAGLIALKGLVSSAKVQVTLAATSAAAVGVFGLALVPWGTGDPVAYNDLDGTGPAPLLITPDPSGAADVAPVPGSGAPVPARPTGNKGPNADLPNGGAMQTPVAPPAAPPAAAQPPAQAAASQVVGAPASPHTQPANPPVTTAAPPAAGKSGRQNTGGPRRHQQDPQPGMDWAPDSDWSPEMDWAPNAADDFDESLPLVSESYSYQTVYAYYDGYYVLTTARVTTKVNSARQTTVVIAPPSGYQPPRYGGGGHSNGRQSPYGGGGRRR
ncbi:sigma-70 family RNA polymerase sigma factor [Actinokineospora enzanensis]|uniref:sigma-70 family RNA polymerase sigma factor n=1 Tax=Actinokineospora enzanensis TaxID=155975 RepID=UPI0003A65F73|nr:sigma-70 family RNA polymerase sigma factor [Actinokineospora enzanensis]